MPTTSSHRDIKKDLLDGGVSGLVFVWVILVGFWGEKVSFRRGFDQAFIF